MILTKNIEVTATGVLLKHLKNLGYDIKSHQKLEISIEDLPKNTRKYVLVKCDVCGKEYEMNYKNYLLSIKNGGYLSCNKCKVNKSKNTCLNKYGVENPSQLNDIKEKKKETLFKNYNTNNVFDLNKEKIKEKYGVENVFQSEEIKEKIKLTCLKKYGVENPQQSDNIMNKRLLKNHSDYNIIKIDIKNKIYTIFCEKCNNNYEITFDLFHSRKCHKIYPCINCNPINSSISIKENELYIFIKKNYDGEIIESDRKILNGKELDIYLPELNLAFEFNGVYWHNELYKDKNYHINKTEKCLEKGIQLIHIWEDDWNHKQEIIKSIILNKLVKTPNKIYARKCEIKEITDNEIINNFLNNNHLQGFIKSSVEIGLYFNDELVSVMTFGNLKEGKYELLRFCNKLYTNVIGGISKLFNFFLKKYKYNEIITYVDRSHSHGKIYEKLKFNFLSQTTPNYYYVINGIRKQNSTIRKQKNYRIFDSGSLKYIY